MNPVINKKIAVLDVDGTLIEGQLQQGLINFLYKKRKVSLLYVFKLNFWFLLYKMHLVKDVRKIFEFGVSYIKGKNQSEISFLIDEYVDTHVREKIFKGSINLINSLRSEGYELLILSTAVNVIISKIASIFSIPDYICTELEIVNGEYTGLISGEIIYGENKLKYLKKYFDDHKYDLSSAVAYADHRSDIPMLKIVGKGYITNPGVVLAHLAQKQRLGIMTTR